MKKMKRGNVTKTAVAQARGYAEALIAAGENVEKEVVMLDVANLLGEAGFYVVLGVRQHLEARVGILRIEGTIPESLGGPQCPPQYPPDYPCP